MGRITNALRLLISINETLPGPPADGERDARHADSQWQGGDGPSDSSQLNSPGSAAAPVAWHGPEYHRPLRRGGEPSDSSSDFQGETGELTGYEAPFGVGPRADGSHESFSWDAWLPGEGYAAPADINRLRDADEHSGGDEASDGSGTEEERRGAGGMRPVGEAAEGSRGVEPSLIESLNFSIEATRVLLDDMTSATGVGGEEMDAVSNSNSDSAEASPSQDVQEEVAGWESLESDSSVDTARLDETTAVPELDRVVSADDHGQFEPVIQPLISAEDDIEWDVERVLPQDSSGEFLEPVASPMPRRPAMEATQPTAYEERMLSEFERSELRLPAMQLARSIRSQLAADRSHVVVVVGPGPTTDVADTLAQLAVLLARDEFARVLLVDANLATAALTERFEAPREGLLESCLDGESWEDFVRPTAIPDLHLLACGDVVTASGIQIQSEEIMRLRRLLTHWRTAYNYVLIDGGSAELPLTRDLIRHADATFLQVSLGRTDERQAAASIEALQQLGGHVLGCLVLETDQ